MREPAVPPPAVVTVPRALWRIGSGLVQALRGAAIVTWRFPGLDVASREAEIARWARGVLRALGVRIEAAGSPAGAGTLFAANHVSWLDILAIHAVAPQACFVSKAVVRDWPLVGRLASAAGTLYLERERKRDAFRLVGQIGAALAAGGSVAVFPEGTTTDGQALLPFHGNLLQAAIDVGARVQPVALRFADVGSPISRAVEFVGTTTLRRSVWQVAAAERLWVRVSFLAPLTTSGADRRTLSHSVQHAIASRLDALDGGMDAIRSAYLPR